MACLLHHLDYIQQGIHTPPLQYQIKFNVSLLILDLVLEIGKTYKRQQIFQPTK